jgi:hypothetical protein
MKTLYVLIIALFFFSCKDLKKPKNNYLPKLTTNQVKQENHPGKKLMKVYCYVCHDATTPEANRIAPPMIAIKRRYIFKNTSKEEFTNDMLAWIQNPNEKDAKMFGAVKRFGVMSKMNYPDDVIRKIADYMYDNELEKPDWFEDHFSQVNKKSLKK